MAEILFIGFLIVLCYHLLSITACTNFMKLIAESHSPHKGHCAFPRQHCATCVMTSSPERSDPHEAFSKGKKEKQKKQNNLCESPQVFWITATTDAYR